MAIKRKNVSTRGTNKRNLLIFKRRIWPFKKSNVNSKRISRTKFLKANDHLRVHRPSHSIPVYNYDISEMEDPECFHCAIGYTLALAQFFGLFPLCGVRSSSPKKLYFKKTAPRTFYSYAVIISLFVMTFISAIHMMKRLNTTAFQVHGGIADATVGAVFYGNNLIATILFFRLTWRWIPLQRDWRALERIMDKDKKWGKLQLRWKFHIITFAILLFALVEHILSMLNNIPKDFSYANTTFENYLDVYMHKSHAFILTNVGYNFTFGMFIFFVSKVATFSWNFMDLFIMLVSTGLAERYKYLNVRILKSKPGQLTGIDWHELRANYAMLSSLVKKVDDNISSIILLSFANNLYFICLQLLNGLTPGDESLFNTIYYFGSFFFLIGRTVSVTLCAAHVNDQSRVVLPYLYTCPASTFTRETERLQQQLTTDDVALSGLRFFSITRNFMLAVAGAVVTYEVVLLQFNIAIKQ